MSQDDQLKRAILAELDWEPSVAAAHIGVAATAGVITLTGHVESFAEKCGAEAAVLRVRGVKAVVQEIEVRLPQDMKRSDPDIAAAAVQRLSWDSSIPPRSVTVEVENGWVSLSGEVAYYYQQQAAEDDIHRLLGVVGVSNGITVKAKLNARVIRDDIIHALKRSWFSNPKTVTVETDGGIVHLTGTVDSWHNWHLAQEIAWAAPGATAVENDIEILD